jgi:hypothetical protein
MSKEANAGAFPGLTRSIMRPATNKLRNAKTCKVPTRVGGAGSSCLFLTYTESTCMSFSEGVGGIKKGLKAVVLPLCA